MRFALNLKPKSIIMNKIILTSLCFALSFSEQSEIAEEYYQKALTKKRALRFDTN